MVLLKKKGMGMSGKSSFIISLDYILYAWSHSDNIIILNQYIKMLPMLATSHQLLIKYIRYAYGGTKLHALYIFSIDELS